MSFRRFFPVALIVCLASPLAAQQPVSERHQRTLALLAAAPAFRAGQDQPVPAQTGKKSAGLAAIYSLLLPGMGELYAGGFSSGRYFLGAEGALWLTYAAFDLHGNDLRNDSRSFAAVHAGITPAGKNDQFFVDIGNFLNVDAYNEKRMRDREPERVYDPAAGYQWAWDSDASRASYRDQRVRSENVFNNRKFVIAVILVNHVASAINAARAAIAHNHEIENGLGSLEIGASVMGGLEHPHGILVTFVHPL